MFLMLKIVMKPKIAKKMSWKNHIFLNNSKTYYYFLTKLGIPMPHMVMHQLVKHYFFYSFLTGR